MRARRRNTDKSKAEMYLRCAREAYRVEYVNGESDEAFWTWVEGQIMPERLVECNAKQEK